MMTSSRAGSMSIADSAAFSRETWPWWSAPQMLITRSKSRTQELVVVVGDVGGEVGRVAG